ncbi:MAG: PKD domain-containing protein [Bacteroidia bacterium]
MKNLFLFCALLLGTLSTVFATHYMGANMHYDCLGNDTVRLYVSTYYDCMGAAIQPNMPVALSGPPPVPAVSFTGLIGSTCQQPNEIGPWISIHWIDITPVCPGTLTGCDILGQNASINGTAESIYYRDYDFSSANCNHYDVSWSNCCRNNIITSGADNQSIYLNGLIIDLSTTPCNNSPRFLNPPVAYICAGAPARFEHQAYDPDGDSLVFRLTACKQGATSNVSYNNGFTPFQPLGPSWNVSLDQQTGDIHLTPTPGNIEVGVLCVEVSEYRNGTLLSTTTRDIQFFVMNCTANNNPRINQLTVLSGANQRGFFAVDGGAGIPLSFSMQVIDPDINDVLTSYFDTLNSNITGLTYSITGTNPQIITANWTPPAAGRYVIRLVSQDQSCPLPSTTMRSVVIEVSPFSVIGNLTHTACESTAGEIDLTVSGGTGPFTFQWSRGDTTEDVTHLPTGSYTVLVIDANGDSVTRSFFINGANLNLGAVVVDTSCSAGSSIQLNVTGGTPPYSYSWNTGDSSATLLGIQSSAGYSVIVTDAVGCKKNGAWWVDPPDSCFNVVQGCVYNDLNQNCVLDSGEMPLANVQVGLSNSGITVLTDSNGHYTIHTTYVGDDTIFVVETPWLQSTCPASSQDTISFDSLGMVVDYKFGMIADTTQDLVAVRCPSWARPGRRTCITLYARNDGGKPMDGTLRWNYDSIFTYQSSSPHFDNHDSLNRVLEWDFFNLLPGQTFRVYVCMGVDSTIGTGHYYCDTLYVDPIFSDSVPSNNVVIYCDTTTNSWDPNDKQAFPQQRLAEGWVLDNEQMLTYTIRFQNTGTDTAFYVFLRDTLDVATLDISSLKVVGASHDYKLRMLENRELEVRFDNINLPAEIQDEEGSNGFFSFTIERKPNLPYGTEIKNHAAIYFDFNDPVITNTVLRTVYDEMIGQATSTEVCQDGGTVSLEVEKGAPPYTYHWANGATSNRSGLSSGFVQGPGQQSVLVTDGIGFETSVPFNLTALPEPDASFQVIISPGNGTIIFDAIADNDSYRWDFGDGSVGSGKNVSHRYASDGNYFVTLIARNACGDDTISQRIDVTVGLEDELFGNSVEVSPNPMKDIAEIRFANTGQKAVSLCLFDLQGREIRSYPATHGERFVVNKADLQAGVYLFRLSGLSTWYGRLVVE